MSMADVQVQRRHEAPDMGAMATRVLRALARRAGEGDVEALEELASLTNTMTEQLGAGVAGYRAMGHSWADIGLALGTSRQNAQQRFGGASTAPAHGPRCSCQLPHCPNTTTGANE